MLTDEKDSNSNRYRNSCTRRNMFSRSGLLCNFEESALNGRLNLFTSLDGFHLQIGRSKTTLFVKLIFVLKSFHSFYHSKLTVHVTI